MPCMCVWLHALARRVHCVRIAQHGRSALIPVICVCITGACVRWHAANAQRISGACVRWRHATAQHAYALHNAS